MPEDNRNARPAGPTRPTPPTPSRGASPVDTSGLMQTSLGWYDPASKTILSPSHSRARAAKAERDEQRRQQEARDFQWQQATLPMMRDELRAAQEAGNRQQQAQIIQQNYPEVARQLSGLIASVRKTVPEDIRGTELEDRYIRNELEQDADFIILDSLHRGYQGFISNPDNAGLFDPRLLTQFRAAGSGDTTGAFADNIQVDDQGRVSMPNTRPTSSGGTGVPLNIQNFSSPEELQEARAALRDLQSRLPEGATPEERRAFAEETFVVNEDGSETSMADLILAQNQLVQGLERRQPQGFTADDLGVPRPYVTPERRGLGGRIIGGNVITPPTPEERGFTQLPDGTYQPRSFSGVPSLAVMRGLEENATPPPIRAMREIVPDDVGFTRLPEGHLRQAIGGVPGYTGKPGGTMVSDIPIDTDAPRYGYYQSPDGTFTALGREGNRGGFATEDEAREWSIANFDPRAIAEREAREQMPIPSVTEAPQPYTPPPSTLQEQFAEGGVFGPGGVVSSFALSDEPLTLEQRARQRASMDGNAVGGMEIFGPRIAGWLFGEDARRKAGRGMVPPEALASLEEHREAVRNPQDAPLRPELFGPPRPAGPPEALASLEEHREAMRKGEQERRSPRISQLGLMAPDAYF